jgi:iron(III) transport system permease protein
VRLRRYFTTSGQIARLFSFVALHLWVLSPLIFPCLAAWLAFNPIVFAETDRLVQLLLHTCGLAFFSAAIALPLGIILALAMTRLPVAGRQLLSAMLILALFLPMPLAAVAWQVVLGNWLPPLQLVPGSVAWRPWTQGLVPAAFVHALAALPWVVFLISAALQSTDRQLEELARLQGGFRKLLKLIVVPRLRLGTGAALLWLIVQTSTEIPITDAMMVRTFAEEVYTQFVSASQGLGQAMLINLPVILITGVVLFCCFQRLKSLPLNSGAELMHPDPVAMARWQRLLWNAVVWIIALSCFVLPVAALVWKAGGADHQNPFVLKRAIFELLKVARTDGLIVLTSLGVAVAVGIVTTSLGWVALLLARRIRGYQLSLLLLGVTLAVTPGPIIGFGLKELIQQLVGWEQAAFHHLGVNAEYPPLRSMLYDQPSPIPGAWASVVRFFPLAMLLAASGLRTIPEELWELSAQSGFSIWKRWRILIYPLTGGMASRSVLLISALTLGEVSASKLVNPPFYSNAILRLFDQMHYGADSTVAALCLLQMASSLLLAGLWLVLTLERDPLDTSA